MPHSTVHTHDIALRVGMLLSLPHLIFSCPSLFGPGERKLCRRLQYRDCVKQDSIQDILESGFFENCKSTSSPATPAIMRNIFRSRPKRLNRHSGRSTPQHSLHAAVTSQGDCFSVGGNFLSERQHHRLVCSKTNVLPLCRGA